MKLAKNAMSEFGEQNILFEKANSQVQYLFDNEHDFDVDEKSQKTSEYHNKAGKILEE